MSVAPLPPPPSPGTDRLSCDRQPWSGSRTFIKSRGPSCHGRTLSRSQSAKRGPNRLVMSMTNRL